MRILPLVLLIGLGTVARPVRAAPPQEPNADAAFVRPPPPATSPWEAIAWYYGSGVAGAIVGLGGGYALASWAGAEGDGLSGPIAGLVIGALVPPLVVAGAQWLSWRVAYPDHDRVWPGVVVAVVAHIGAFVAAVLGGVSVRNDAEAAVLITGEAVVLPALTSVAAYLLRREPAAAAPTDGVAP